MYCVLSCLLILIVNWHFKLLLMHIRNFAIIVVVFAIFVLTLLIINWLGPLDTLRINSSQLPELLKLRQRSIAYLENQLPEDAIPLLDEIASRFPAEEAFAQHNRAVGLTLQLELENAEANPSKFAAQISATERQIESVISTDPENAIPYLLLSRVYKIKGNVPEQIAAAINATKRSKNNPSVWFELFRARSESNTQSDELVKSLEALEQVIAFAPDNVWALLQVLNYQSQLHHREIIVSLSRIEDMIAPFANGIEQRTRLNPLKLIPDILAAVTSENWDVVIRQCRLLGNILRPEEIAQSDRMILMPNTLEFIRTRYSETTEAMILSQPLNIPKAIDVRFSTEQIELPKNLGELKRVEIADMDLNGSYEIVMLTDNQLTVMEPEIGGKIGNVIASTKIDAGYSNFILADLDQDSDPNRSSNIEGAPCALADLDLICFGSAGIAIYENLMGNPSVDSVDHSMFRKIDSDSLINLSNVSAVTAADFDLDGDLDLIIIDSEGSVSLWANYRAFQFSDVTARSALPPDEFFCVEAIAIDLDRDVDLDIVLRGRKTIGYLENLRHGSLRWKEIDSSGEGKSITDLKIVDFDANASWDLLFCRDEEISYLPSKISSPGSIRWSETIINIGLSGEEMYLLDYDNDGFQDIALKENHSEKIEVLRRKGELQFEQTKPSLEWTSNNLGPETRSTVAVEDLDGDGDLDGLIWNQTGIWWQRNEGGNQNPFLKIALHGQQVKGEQTSASGRVNHYGWGSLMELKAGDNYQPRVVDSQVLHFGLGATKQADVVRVVWPNGIPQNVIEPKNNLFICEEQRLKGSCPYLYAWNGNRFEFVTDLLWAAPIGLQFAEGVIAPTRPWEYLLIESDQLKPRADKYELRLTEELWEAAYFDQVRLLAVDHPANLDIYSNEKVASSTTPEFKIHVVENPRVPESIIDDQGNDLLPLLKLRDDRYAKPFSQKHFQGVTEPWFMEIDLGELSNTKTIKLFLHGWVFPSDTSLNVALSQSQDMPAPRPPYLQVPNASGAWETIDPSCGFPGGKSKTIVIDLTDRFLTDDYRVRIVSSMEIYWDQLFYSTDDNPPGMTPQVLEMEASHLHHRGVSQVKPHPGLGPESYDYNLVNTMPTWPPVHGFFTSYGDVDHLLRAEDDQLVVMQPGDEIVMRFQVPTNEVPPGWTRDFILHNVGYDKDFDLNTVYGQSSEPFPTRTTAQYPAMRASDTPPAPAGMSPQSREQRHRLFWTAIRDLAN
ncbi:FG-GAP repeat protein [Rubinisphaera italica]|uniref:FG-GAP repeat protein n=2 Tax=Rubinisphaera italica TaxID=2527969 RepID=A0A5C5XHH5_9PLAN|nr:FG-GAP repeat protein [Rubinisphaera italica]